MGFLISCHIIVNDLQAIKNIGEGKQGGVGKKGVCLGPEKKKKKTEITSIRTGVYSLKCNC